MRVRRGLRPSVVSIANSLALSAFDIAVGTRIHTADDRRIDAAAVIWATGYRSDCTFVHANVTEAADNHVGADAAWSNCAEGVTIEMCTIALPLVGS